MPVSGSVAKLNSPVNGVWSLAETRVIADLCQAARMRRAVDSGPRWVTATPSTAAAEQVANAVLAAVETPSEVPGTMIGGEMIRSQSPLASVVMGVPSAEPLATAPEAVEAPPTMVNTCRYGRAT